MSRWVGCINSRFRFENFVLDASNSEAYEAAQKVAKGLSCGIPVVIHSEAGMGKTHLLHAIGNEVLRSNPKAKVALFSAEWFSSEFISAKRNKTIETFRAKITRHYSIFMVDQMTFIDRKPSAQIELFLTLRDYSRNGCGIVLASALPIEAMTEWLDEFKGWMQSGINVGITEPTVESRLVFLKNNLAEKGMPTNDKLVECLHLMAGTSFRELETAVILLQAASRLDSVHPTAEYTRKVLEQ